MTGKWPWAARLPCWCCKSTPWLESMKPVQPHLHTPSAPPRCCSLPSSDTAAGTPPSPRLLCPNNNDNNISDKDKKPPVVLSPAEQCSSSLIARHSGLFCLSMHCFYPTVFIATQQTVNTVHYKSGSCCRGESIIPGSTVSTSLSSVLWKNGIACNFHLHCIN